MNKKILIGSIIAVVIITLLSFSSVVGYRSVKSDLDISVEEDVTPTPIALVFQLIAKLRNHPNIQNVESEDDLLQIIENDAELNGIIEKLKSYSCGCEDEQTTEGVYPIIICLILFVIFAVAINFSPFPVGPLVLISYGTADKLNCPFTKVR